MVLLDTSDRDFQHPLGWFAGYCEAAEMRFNTTNFVAMVFCQKMVEFSLCVRMGLDFLPQVKEFKYPKVLKWRVGWNWRLAG